MNPPDQAAVTMIDRVIAKLEADLSALRTAREILGRSGSEMITGAEYRAKYAPDESPAAPPAFGRDRAGTTALYAALAAHAGELEPKACRAVKLRAEGKLPSEIAASMKLTVKQVGNLLVQARRKLMGSRDRGAARTPDNAGADDSAPDEPEPAASVDLKSAGAASGVNELLELRLEKLRGVTAVRPPWATVGAIVVGKKDDQGEGLFRVLAHHDNAMTRVERVNRYAKKIGRKSFLLVPGELVRPAAVRAGNRGKTIYFVHAEAAS